MLRQQRVDTLAKRQARRVNPKDRRDSERGMATERHRPRVREMGSLIVNATGTVHAESMAGGAVAAGAASILVLGMPLAGRADGMK